MASAGAAPGLGGRSAGNQSMKSFRVGHAVAGHAGYIPSSDALPIPLKFGPSERENEADRGRAVSPPKEMHVDRIGTAVTEYDRTVGSPSKSRGGSPVGQLGSSTRSVSFANVISVKPPRRSRFIHGSTYKAEFIPQKDSLVSERERSRPVSIAMKRPDTGKVVPDYCSTTYWHDLCHDKFNPARSAAPKKSVVPINISKRKPEPKVLASDALGGVRSAYQMSFGHVPGRRVASAPCKRRDLVEHATHRDLFSGTAKATLRPPSYQGFVPRNERVKQAWSHAKGENDRAPLGYGNLFTLHQYDHFLPGSTIFRCQSAFNADQELRPKPAGTTTYTASNDWNDDKALTQSVQIDGVHGKTNEMNKFFVAGQFKSDSAIQDAEMYYRRVRPYEGSPRITVPSKTNAAGARFEIFQKQSQESSAPSQ